MKYLIFDFDGTLVDSMEAWASSILRVLQNNNIPCPADLIKMVTPLGTRGTAEYLSRTFSVRETPDEIVDFMGKYAYQEYAENILAKETVVDTLHHLKAGGYSLNVLTASPHATLDVCLKRLGIFELFENVWSCDDFGTTKTDERIYHMSAERLGADVADCIFLDDNINAVSTAKRAGMRVIGVYDKTSEELVAEMKAVCGGYIYKFSELIPLLEG